MEGTKIRVKVKNITKAGIRAIYDKEEISPITVFIARDHHYNSVEFSKVKQDVSSIKSMMNEVMQIVAEKETITKEVADADTQKRFKDIEKVILPFLYNLSKSDEPYIHWPNRGPIIKAQIEKVLKLTRG